jgi:hypothetical protein
MEHHMNISKQPDMSSYNRDRISGQFSRLEQGVFPLGNTAQNLRVGFVMQYRAHLTQ